MNEQEILSILENMTPDELEALEQTQFPEEVVKQAEASLEMTEANEKLANALYAYGMLKADTEFAESELAEGETLSKEASAEFAEDAAEIETAIDEALESSGIAEIEDEALLHKEAQAAAAYIFSGYVDQLEKIAARKSGAKEKIKIMLEKAHGKMKHGMNKAKGAAGVAMKHMGKHKGALAAGAAGLAAGYGAYAAKKHMDKKASELTIAEITEEVFNKVAAEQAVTEGLEKCAAAGAKIGEKMKHMLGKGVAHMKHHKSKYLSGAAGVAAGAAGAHMAHKKNK